MIETIPKWKEAERVLDEGFILAIQGGRVCVIESEVPEKVGELYLPTDQKEVIATDGIVVAVGDGVTFCKPGERIYFARYSGAKCSIAGQDFRIMNEDEILGRWK